MMAADARVTAATLSYNTGDLLVCFRKNPSGSYDLVVDAGPISSIVSMTAGQKVVLNPSKYTSAQLKLVGGTNNLAWTAFTYVSGGPTTNTVYMSNPWADANTPGDPYNRVAASGQSGLIGYLASVAYAATNSLYVDTADSTTTAALVAESTAASPFESYFNALGLQNYNNFRNTFQADPEQITAANFTSGTPPVRADFYELDSYSGPFPPAGKYLGYFEFATNGVMTYTAGAFSAGVTVPSNLSIIHRGTTNIVSFLTGTSGTYTLRGTNNLVAGSKTSRTNWPALGSVSGNGSQLTLTNVTSATNMFYLISAQ